MRLPPSPLRRRLELAAVLAAALVALGPHAVRAQPAAGHRTFRLHPPLRVERLDTRQGLPQITVTSIAQDALGFVWFGTQEGGLARFDGETMRTWRIDPDDPDALSTGWITALQAATDGSVWIGTDDGLFRYDSNTDRLTHFRAAPDQPDALSFDTILALLAGKDGALWIGAGDGLLNRYDPSTRKFQHIELNQGQSPFAISSLALGRDGSIWIGTDGGGVLRFDPATKTTGERLAGEKTLPSDTVRAVLEDRAGTLWIGTDRGLVSRDPGGTLRQYTTETSATAALSDDRVTALFEAPDGSLWVGTEDGLNQIPPGRDRVIRYAGDPEQAAATKDFPERVNVVFQDREGVLYVGNLTGLRKLNPMQFRFHARAASPITGRALSFAEAPDHVLWVGTERSGLARVDPQEGTMTLFAALGAAGADRVALDHEISALHLDEKGVLWLAMTGVGLVRFEPATGAQRVFSFGGRSASMGRVNRILGAGGALWLATSRTGLIRFDPADGRFTAVAGPKTGLTGTDSVYTLVLDASDPRTLWVGLDRGLARVDLTSRTSSLIRVGGDRPTAVYGIHQDRQGSLWLATSGMRLVRLDPRSGATASFGDAAGIPDVALHGVLPDRAGRLWLPTAGAGLLAFDPARPSALRYGPADGVSLQFAPTGHTVGASGAIYLNGLDEYVYFSPDEIKPAAFAPRIVPTGFKVFNQDARLARPIWLSPPIELGYRESDVSITFAALSFAAPRELRYRYKLDGVDSDWVETRRRFVRYSNLPGGDHRFHLRVADSHGTWSDQELSLTLSVGVPPWRTWWAYTLYAIILVSSALLVWRAQVRRLDNLRRTQSLELAERELELTGAVQTGFLPLSDRFESGPIRLQGFYRPADRASGDWWWYEAGTNGRQDSIMVMAGDVTGHGAGPAMVTAAAATAFAVGQRYGRAMVDRLVDLNEVVLASGLGRYQMTMTGVELDVRSGRLRFHSAGGLPVVRLPKAGQGKVLPCRGTPLGTTNFELGMTEAQIEPGDRFVVFTDGIPDARIGEGRQLGLRRFLRICEATARMPIADALGQIIARSDQARGANPQEDDWTLVIVEWLG